MTFLHKKSSEIAFLTAENFSSKISDEILQEIHTLANMYTARYLTSVYTTGTMNLT